MKLHLRLGTLFLVAILVVAAELLRGVGIVRKLLYTAAALILVMAAVHEWRQ